MKVISLLWGYSLGGIGKVALTYGKLDQVSNIDILTIVIQPKSKHVDLSPLQHINSKIINIRNKFDFSWISELKSIFNNYNPNVLFVHGFNGPIIAVFLKFFFYPKIDIVCSYHGKYNGPTALKKYLELLYNNLPILIYKRSSKKVITVCNYFEKELNLKGVNSNKIITIHNGLVFDANTSIINEQNDNPKEIIRIGFVGRLDPIKGIDVLLNALFILQNDLNNKDWELYLVGSGPLLNELKTQVIKLDLVDKIYFMGMQNNIEDWLNRFDIFVLPSHLEAHSISLLEAMRAKKAIIATNVGGNPESITNGIEGVLVEPNEPNILAIAIEDIMNNNKLRIQYEDAAYNRFQKEFTETVALNKLVNCFNSL